MSYAHILPRERILIEEYRNTGKSLGYIARQLNRSKSTISYELGRVQPYNALQAQIDYDNKRKNCGCKRSVNLDDVTHILIHLKKGWSPETIVGRYEKRLVSLSLLVFQVFIATLPKDFFNYPKSFSFVKVRN